MPGIGVTVDLDLPEVEIDDEVIADWIEARLNDARNIFVQSVSRTEKTRGGATYYGQYRYVRRGQRMVRRRQRIEHVASAPGEYPATDSGRLVNSVWFQMLDDQHGLIYSDVKYAGYLTEGTAHMAARKMLEDALTEVLASRPATDALASAVKITNVKR